MRKPGLGVAQQRFVDIAQVLAAPVGVDNQAGATPAVRRGDFNVDQRNESYVLLNASGRLKDAYIMAALVYAPNGTFNDFDPKTKSDARTDHIFLSLAFTVAQYGIATDTYGGGKTSSDYYPVIIEARYGQPK